MTIQEAVKNYRKAQDENTAANKAMQEATEQSIHQDRPQIIGGRTA